jgi:DNA-binding MarR family transcriptional regulator
VSTADDRELLELYLQVARGLGAQLYEVAVRHDLTPVQAMTLSHLGDGGAATKEIAARLCCDPSNATGIVDQLERRGLVRRTTPPEDRRKRVVVPTDDGRAVVSGLREAIASTAGLFDRLTPADRSELRRILEVLAASA